MNKKTLIAGSILTLGILGSATAFAATNTGTNGSTNSTTAGNANRSNGFGNGPANGHFNRQGHAPGGMGLEADVATVLGMSATTIQSDLQAGQSLVQIAQTKGISEATLIADLKAAQKTHLDQAVQSGKMTAAQEQTMLTNMDAHLKQMVEQKGGFDQGHGPGGMGMGGRGPGFGGPGAMSDLTTTLGISAATLQADFQAGQSLVQIAQTKGISESTLIADLKAAQKTHLDQAVQSGKMTAAQEQTMLTNMDEHLKQMVEQKGGFDHGHGPGGMGMGRGMNGAMNGSTNSGTSAGTSTTTGNSTTTSTNSGI